MIGAYLSPDESLARNRAGGMRKTENAKNPIKNSNRLQIW